MLILLDSLCRGIYSNFTNLVTKWFKSSKDVKGNDITLTLEYIDLPHNIRQDDVHSCASFVCLYSYIVSMLSDEYRTRNNWFSSIKEKITKYINPQSTILEFK